MPLIPPVGAVARPVTAAPTSAATAAPQTSNSGSAFGEAVTKALDDLESTQAKADALARDAATGRLQSVEEYLMAASEAQLAMQLTVAVRNKAVEAFNEIMRMQI